MKRVITVPALVAVLSLPAMADITNNSNCTEGVLGTSANGSTANIDANWSQNRININWYNGDTKVSESYCMYDDTITLPTQPTKPGYTFAGWTLRATPERTLVANCRNIQNEQDCENSYEFNAGCIDGGDIDNPCVWTGVGQFSYCGKSLQCVGGSN